MSASAPSPVQDMLVCINSLRLILKKELYRGRHWVVSTESIMIKDEPESTDRVATTATLPVRTASVAVAKPDIPTIKPEISASDTAKPFPAEEKKEIKINTISTPCTNPIMFVRLCPTETEMKQSMPYCDEAGNYFLSMIREAGIPAETAIKTYLCRFHLDYLPKDSVQIARWREEFLKQLADIKPAVVVSLGERVSQILSGVEKPIDDLRASPISIQDIPFIFCWDPLYMMKKKNMRNDLILELKNNLTPLIRS